MNYKNLFIISLAVASVYGYAAVNERSGGLSIRQSAVEDSPVKISAASLRGNSEESQQAKQPAKINYSIELPFELTPTEDEVKLFTIIDGNQDGRMWYYNANLGGLVSPYGKGSDCDDWAIFPAVRFDNVDNNYELSFDMLNNMRGSNFISSFEFWIGTSATAEGMTTKIAEIKDFYSVSTTEKTHQAIQFGIPGDAGVYYVGIHCITPLDYKLEDGTSISGWPTTFSNIAMQQIDSSALAPAKAENVTVTAGEEGELTATVSFTMPTTAMNGSELASKELTAVVTSDADSKTVTGLPGSEQSVVLTTNQGDNTITITVNGDADGEPLTTTVYTGEVLPMRVHNLAGVLSRDNMNYTLTWTPPTEGEGGGYVNFDKLEYDIYLYDSSKGDYDYLTTAGKELTYTYQAAEGAQLRTVRLAVFARNSAGVSLDRTPWIDQDDVYVSDMVGTPYSLPAVENFDNLNMKYTPITIQYPNEDYRGRWYIGDPSECVADENQSALICYNPYDEDSTMGRVALPKFSTKGLQNASFSITAMLYADYASTLSVYVRNYDEEPTLLGTIDCNKENGWTTVDYPLPAQFQDNEWVQIYIDCDLEEVDYMYAVDSYSLKQSAANDLAVMGVSGNETPALGESSTYVAEVSNIGFNEAAFSGTFTVTVDESIVSTAESESTTLQAGATAYLPYEFTPTADMIGHNVKVSYTLTSVTDEVSANNSGFAVVTVRRSETPTVLDLQATGGESGVSLTWGEPIVAKTITESFEAEEAFSYGSELAGFINYDGDGKTVYKFSNNPMPNENLAKAFMVINSDQLEYSDGLEAVSGVQYLMATCPEQTSAEPTPVAADDWLISPMTLGGEYVSFYLNIINESYPESVQIMYSENGTATEDFKKLDEFTIYKHGWKRYEYQLPENAKYFAIHYVSQDMFGVMVDDITYASATDLYNITGYNVYRDGEYIGTTTSRNYIDGTAALGNTYSYNVTTLVPEEGAMSNTAVIRYDVSGLSDLCGDDESAACEYFTLQGVKVDRANLTHGIYICKQGTKIMKKMVNNSK